MQQQAARAELLLDAQGAREICGAPRLWAKVVGEGQSQFFVMMWCEKSKERGKKKKRKEKNKKQNRDVGALQLMGQERALRTTDSGKSPRD